MSGSISSLSNRKTPEDNPVLPRGTVVLLNSDTECRFMTVSDWKAGQVYCRWHDDGGNLVGDWFYPSELTKESELDEAGEGTE